MRYAINPDKQIQTRTEASPGAKGLCIACKAEMIPKCGDHRIHHWAHKKKSSKCDEWWETETEWHRNWNNQFPVEWQESVIVDEDDGTKHIADVKTANNLVIEFQHSYINQHDQQKREKFYSKNGGMLWVVDGTRLETDYEKFSQNQPNWFEQPINQFISGWSFLNVTFPKNWRNRPVLVAFDWGKQFHNLVVLCPREKTSEIGKYYLVPRSEFPARISSLTTLPYTEMFDDRVPDPNLYFRNATATPGRYEVGRFIKNKWVWTIEED